MAEERNSKPSPLTSCYISTDVYQEGQDKSPPQMYIKRGKQDKSSPQLVQQLLHNKIPGLAPGLFSHLRVA
jgi:hypothetical protein